MKEIVLNTGAVALVDDEDFECVCRIKWFQHSAGYACGYDSELYSRLRAAGATSSEARNRSIVLLHRFVMEPPAGMVVDHINHNRLDCRRANMRVVTHHENMQNRSKVLRDGFSSRYRGVAAHSRGFIVQFGKAYIGVRPDEEEAARLFDAVARVAGFPESQLNFPRSVSV